MKYLPLRTFESITSALNFDTPDTHIVGSCDLYTTKAAGADKKLYKQIETSLESQHESLLQLSASLPTPQQKSLTESINLSRSSPFGPLSQISSRRTFAYLIATMNASHPDYEFSSVLRPSDFRRERSLRSVMNTIDSAIYNHKGRVGAPQVIPSAWVPPAPTTSKSKNTGSKLNGKNHADSLGGLGAAGISSTCLRTWSPYMWMLIDHEMDLNQCDIYVYTPEDDPFDGEEGSIWSMHYFFFNKSRKRVCYLYLRGLSVISHSPVQAPVAPKRRHSRFNSLGGSVSMGAQKRARYWLGERAEDYIGSGYGDGDEEAVFADHYGDDEVDADEDVDALDDLVRGESLSPDVDDEDDDDDDDEDDGYENRLVEKWRASSGVRAMSEHAVENMEV